MNRCKISLPLAASISLSLLPMLACTNSVESRSIASRIDRASERWYGLFQDNLDRLHPDDQWGIRGFAEDGRLRLSYYEFCECADCPQRSVEALVLGDYAEQALPFVLIEFASDHSEGWTVFATLNSRGRVVLRTEGGSGQTILDWLRRDTGSEVVHEITLNGRESGEFISNLRRIVAATDGSAFLSRVNTSDTTELIGVCVSWDGAEFVGLTHGFCWDDEDGLGPDEVGPFAKWDASKIPHRYRVPTLELIQFVCWSWGEAFRLRLGPYSGIEPL